MNDISKHRLFVCHPRLITTSATFRAKKHIPQIKLLLWTAFLLVTFSGLAHAQSPAGLSADTQLAAPSPMESWRKQMMQSRDKQPGCYEATYPDKQWHSIPCEAPPAALIKKQQRMVKPHDARTDGDYIATSTGNINSATGALSITNNTYAKGFGYSKGQGGVNNEFTIQLNTNTFATTECNGHPGCVGWEQFMIDSGGSIHIQKWLLNYLNANATTCPFPPQNSGTDGRGGCYINLANVAFPILPFASFSGYVLEGEAQGSMDFITLFMPSGKMISAPMADFGLAGHWKQAEYNVFGECCGDETIFNPHTHVNVNLTLEDGTNSPPVCTGHTSFAAETTNLSKGNCNLAAPPNVGIYFEEEAGPIVWDVEPKSGADAGGTSITVTGEGFDPIDLPARSIAAIPASAPIFTVENLGGLELIRITPRWPAH